MQLFVLENKNYKSIFSIQIKKFITMGNDDHIEEHIFHI